MTLTRQRYKGQQIGHHAVVIYDRENSDAWIESTCALEIGNGDFR